MTTKIFYFLVALFSITMVFGLFDTGYFIGLSKENVKLVNMKAFNIHSYEINSSLAYGSYEASEFIRYKDYDEAVNFRGFYKDNALHKLSSDTAISKDGQIDLNGNAKYYNIDENISYFSDHLIYGDNKIKSHTAFTIIQNQDKIVANDGIYDIKNKVIQANKVKGIFQK